MDTLAKSDVFFFITSVAVVMVTAAIIVIAFYVVKILSDLKHIMRRAKHETELIVEDIDNLRGNVKREGMKWKFFSRFFSNLKRKK